MYNIRIDESLASLEQSILSPSGGGVRGNREALDTFYKTKDLKLSGLSDAIRLAEQDLALAKTGKELSGDTSNQDVDGAKTAFATSRYSEEIARK